MYLYITYNKLFQLEKLISRHQLLNQSAKDAFKSYLRAYDAHHLKVIFDIETLDLAKAAKSFGFATPPAVQLKITKGFKQKKKGGEKNNISKQKGNNKKSLS